MNEIQFPPSVDDRLKELSKYQGEDMVVSSLELELEFSKRQTPFFGLKSRIPTLDKLIEGFQGGELVTISGPTKHGKTLLAQSLTMSFIKQQEAPLWFSFEVPPRQFLAQFPDLPLFYMPRKMKPHILQWLFSRIGEGFIKYHTRVIFIDHLHYLFDMAKVKSPSLEIGTVIRKLKSLAVKYEFIVFLLCHTTKGKQETAAGLSYESIRDSSFVSQESDCVLMIKRDPARGQNAATLQVEFHRRTGVLDGRVKLIKQDGFLVEEAGGGSQVEPPKSAGRNYADN